MVKDQLDKCCDTELCLTPGGCRNARQNPHLMPSPITNRMEEHTAKATDQQLQQITVFYGSRVCVWDVTDIQARAIICMAKQEMEETAGSVVHRNNNNNCKEVPSTTLWTPSVSVQTQPPAANPAAGLSMTRSLQRFLQNRRTRAVDHSPNLYSHGHLAPPPS